jgi:hypothetical protein
LRNLAPIGVSTYSRINHLKQTIEALQKNTLSKESDLYIFSDAPKPGDEEKIAKVRNYIHTIDGFKTVNILERKTNSRVKNNRGGIKQLLDEYGRMIFMEDDIVTAPRFLEFMNNALEFYKDDNKIISISGYSPPIILPSDYKNDIYILRRFNAWGVGFWKNKYNLINHKIDKNEYHKNIKNNKFYKKIIENGEDIPGMLEQEVNGRIDALDVKIMYQQVLNDWYSLYPRRSLVQNIGHDSSGIHCGINNKFNVEMWDKVGKFEFIKGIRPDERIIKANRKFRRIGVQGKIVKLTKQIGVYSYLKRINDSIKK